jgi:hypothetical protein
MEVSMRSELQGNITRVRYELGGSFTVELDGPSDPVIADNQTNQLAIDAAFERRAPVVLELEGARIRRVQSDLPPDEPVAPSRRGQAVFITRISTQVEATTGELIAEVFSTANQARTKDPVIHLLCHGAYVSKHPLALELADSEIKAVVKEHIE